MFVIQPCDGLFLATREHTTPKKGKQVFPGTYPGNRAKIMYVELGETPSEGQSLAVINPEREYVPYIHTGNRVLTGKGVHWTSDPLRAYQFESKRSAMLFIKRELIAIDPCEREYMVKEVSSDVTGMVVTDTTADAAPSRYRAVERHLDRIPVPTKGIGLKRIRD